MQQLIADLQQAEERCVLVEAEVREEVANEMAQVRWRGRGRARGQSRAAQGEKAGQGSCDLLDHLFLERCHLLSLAAPTCHCSILPLQTAPPPRPPQHIHSCCATWRRATGNAWRLRWRRWSGSRGWAAAQVRWLWCLGQRTAPHPCLPLLLTNRMPPAPAAEGTRRGCGRSGKAAADAAQAADSAELPAAREEAEWLREQMAEAQAHAEQQAEEAAEHAAELEAAATQAHQAATQAQDQLAAEQRRAAGLEEELAAARQHAADVQARLAAEQQRAAALEAELASTQRQVVAAAASTDGMQQELAGERQRAAALEAELEAAQAAVASTQAVAAQQYQAQMKEAVTQLKVGGVLGRVEGRLAGEAVGCRRWWPMVAMPCP